MYAAVLGPLWVFASSVMAHVASKTSSWGVNFDPAELLLPMDSMSEVKFSANLQREDIDYGVVHVVTSDGRIASPYPTDKIYLLKNENISDPGSWSSAFNITGNFLGYAEVYLQLRDNREGTVLSSSNSVTVKVVRSERVVDKLFTYSVAVLVSVIYINFGCALDWSAFKKTVRRPLGPVIGFTSQFLVMPLVSFIFLYTIYR
jgi:sodium/bile acid cotransporter 3/5